VNIHQHDGAALFNTEGNVLAKAVVPQSRSGKRSSRLFSHFSESAIAIISVSARNPSRMFPVVVVVVGVFSVSPRSKPMSVLRESPTGG